MLLLLPLDAKYCSLHSSRRYWDNGVPTLLFSCLLF
jgi:hypothetical protein